MGEPNVRKSVKDLKASLLAQSPGGIVLPQFAGAPPPLPRLSSRESSHETVDRTKSESSLTGGSSHSLLSPPHSQSERSLMSPDEAAERETGDKFDVENSLNAAALSKPIMAPGRRRPSRVENLVAAIPAENRLTEKDLVVMSEEAKVTSYGVLSLDAPAELSATEQWLLTKIVQLERNYQERIAALEQETAALREALTNAGIAIAPRSPPPSASTTSTPQVQNMKRIQTTATPSPTSPLIKKTVVPVPAVKRSDSNDSAASSASMMRRMSSEPSAAVPQSPSALKKDSGITEAGSPMGPARKVPAVPQGPRPVPNAPKEDEALPRPELPATVTDAPPTPPVKVVATEPDMSPKDEHSSKDLAVEEPAIDEDEDADSDLVDML